mgnify:CR=1 FL=1|jgi:hypothetical protein
MVLDKLILRTNERLENLRQAERLVEKPNTRLEFAQKDFLDSTLALNEDLLISLLDLRKAQKEEYRPHLSVL